MRHLAILAAGVFLIGAGVHAGAGVVSPAGMSRGDHSSIVFVQDKQKSETVTQRVKRSVKRTWRKLTGYQFDVGCPIPIPLTHKTCTQTGKDVEDARSKCMSRHAFCYVTRADKS
jgi:hypothetical protein